MSRFRGSAKAAGTAALVVLAVGFVAARASQRQQLRALESSASMLARECAVEAGTVVGELESHSARALAARRWGGDPAWRGEIETWLEGRDHAFALLLDPRGEVVMAAGRFDRPRWSKAVATLARAEGPALRGWRANASGEYVVSLLRTQAAARAASSKAAWSVLAQPRDEILAGEACAAARADLQALTFVLPESDGRGVSALGVEPTATLPVAGGAGVRVAFAIGEPANAWVPLLLTAVLALLAAAFVYAWESPARRLEHELEERARQLEHLNRSWLEEVGRRKSVERRISLSESRDPLTRLFTRADLVARLERGLELARAEEDFAVAVVFIAVDRLKNVNESLGHDGGDELISRLGQRLWAAARPEGEPARIGGGRFAVVLFDVGGEGRAMHVAERIQAELSQPTELRGHEIFPSLSIGVFVSRLGLDRAETALLKAEMAMSRAKASGGDAAVHFEASMMDNAGSQLQLESDLRRAIGGGEFEAHYQPVMALEDTRPVGLEALLRWRHPADGIIMPDAFIPLAEETGLIVPLTQWVLAEGARQLSEWRRSWPELGDIYLSINLSSRDLEQLDVVQQVEALLAEEELPPGALRIEVTESGLINDLDRAAATLEAFRRLEIPLLLDDFGTGYSSLSYLHRLPFDFVKIDRSFVLPLASPQGDREIVRAIVDLTRCFGMKAIAEGVESEGNASVLRELGCEFGQGFHYSQPLPPTEVPPFLLATRSRPARS